MSADAQKFAARWSPAVWIITTAVLGLIIGVEVLLVRLAYSASGDNVTKALLVAAMLLPVGIFGIVALLAPWGYTIRSGAIVVNRLGPAVVLRFAQICYYEPTGSRSGHDARCNKGCDLAAPGGCLSSGSAEQQTTT